MREVRVKLVKFRKERFLTYHNCEEYADDGHANYGGPVRYSNDRRQCHAGRVDGNAEIADLPNNVRGRGEATYGATLESETKGDQANGDR